MKKKIIYKITLILIILAILIGNIESIANESTDNMIKLHDGKIAVYKNLDNADIVLANGQNISNISTTRKITEIEEEQQEEITNKELINICFILDMSRSMSGHKAKMNSGMKKLFEMLYENIQSGGPYVKISLFPGPHYKRGMSKGYFNDNVYSVGLDGLEDIDYLEEKVVGLFCPDFGTYVKEAINGEEESFPDCLNFWNQCEDNDETSDSLTIWLGDGGTSVNAEWIADYVEKIINSRKNSYFAFGKFGIIDSRFIPARDFGFDSRVVMLDIGDLDLSEWLKNECYEYITTRNVSFQDGGSQIQQKNGFFEADNGYNAIVDEEILYGATLIADYSIHIQTKEELNKIEIIDYIPEGMQVVSTDPGGTYNPNDNTVTFEINETVRDEKVVRLTLSKVLTSAEDIQEMENTVDVTVTTAKGETYTTIPDNPYATEQQKYDARVHSKKLSIIPPFGSSDEEKQHASIINQITNHWKAIAITIVWILVAIYFIKQIKRRNNK